ARAAQQPGELVFGESVGHGRHSTEDRRWVGSERNRHRKGLARSRFGVFAKVDRASAMRKPPHDELVRRDELLAVDAEVLTRLARSARHREPPGDKRPGVFRPASLDRKTRKVDLLALPHHLLAWRAGNFLRRHMHHLPPDRNPALEHVAKSSGRLRLLEESEQFTDLP